MNTVSDIATDPAAWQNGDSRRQDRPDSDAITTFQLGYANRTLGYRLPEKNRKEGAELRGHLQSLGVFRQSGHEHFSGSLVVPINDATGRVVEMFGRKIGDNLRPGTPNHLYLPGPHAGVFNLAAVIASAEVIICESLVDAMTFWCAGNRHVTAAFGTEGFTDELRGALLGNSVRRVLVAFDRDDPDLRPGLDQGTAGGARSDPPRGDQQPPPLGPSPVSFCSGHEWRWP